MGPQPGTDEAARRAVKRARSAMREADRELARWEERRNIESLGIGYHTAPREEEDEDGR